METLKAWGTAVWAGLSGVGGLVLLDVVLVAALLMIPLGLGGNFVLLGTALLIGFLTKFTVISVWVIAVFAILVILGEVVEAVLGSFVAQKFGASKWGMLGAFLGGLVGAVIGTAWLPIIGSLIGSFAGAAAGAVALELINGKETAPGLKAGWGAFLGKVLATAFKLGVGFGMALYLVIRTH